MMNELKCLADRNREQPMSAMDYQQYLDITPDKRSGKPCLKQTRITVYDVLGWLAQGMTTEEIVAEYPELTPEQIQACLAYAADREHHSLTITAA